jgi:hypothetical protein
MLNLTWHDYGKNWPLIFRKYQANDLLNWYTSNSSEFKGKLENGNNSAAEFDTKFINIADISTKSYKNPWVELDFVNSSALFINLVSNSASELLPFSSFPLNSEELLYNKYI